jgi:hypothetical protein
MPKEARHHHYLPQCYLRGFAVGSGKRCRLTVATIAGKHYFETNPRNVGGVRDFNRIDIAGFTPDAVEGMLANFEGQVATALRNVAESLKFDGDDRVFILNLVALLAVRSPQMREHWRQMEESLMKKMLGLSLSSKDRWEAQQAAMVKAGKGPKPGEPTISYEQAKEFYQKDEYDITLNREHHLEIEFKAHNAVLNALMDRKWEMHAIASDNVGCFVTTDRPVVLTWNNPEEVPALYRESPGFGMPDTEVLFPITKNLIVIGSFEGKDGTVSATTSFAAGANTKMIHHAFEQMYGPKKVIPYIGPDLKFYNDRNFFDRWERFKRKPD